MDISTSPFRQKDPQHSAYRTIELNTPSSDTAHITEVACTVVRHIYRPGYRYTKVGVLLMNL